MIHLKELTKEQERVLLEQGLYPQQWLLVADYPDKLIIQQRDGGARTTVYKRQRGGGRG